MLNNFFRRPPPPPPPAPPPVDFVAVATPTGLVLLLSVLFFFFCLRKPSKPPPTDEEPQHKRLSFTLPDGWLDEDFEISLTQLVRRRLSRLDLSPRQLVGSIVTSLGQRAFFYISSALALIAFGAQYGLSRIRRLDGSGLEWARQLAERVKARVQTLVGGLRYEAVATRLYSAIDADGSGTVDATELHMQCLKIYLTVTQYAPQVLTPPSKAHTDLLFASFDLVGRPG